MKKVQKGDPGYLDHKKRIEIIRTIIYFGIVAAVFLLGYSQTHTRRNILTVVAILGCLLIPPVIGKRRMRSGRKQGFLQCVTTW